MDATADNQPNLSLNGVHKTYTGRGLSVAVLRDLTLDVGPGTFVAVRGPSGCGKSTLLLVCGGLLSPDAGDVRVLGHDPYALAARERARFRAGHIGFVFQQFHLIPYLSIIDNVLLPCLALKRPDAHERAAALIERFGLSHRLRHVPAELSIGERQRVGLARALLNEPAVVLADEPTGNLDEESGRLVLGALAEYARGGRIVLMVTHDSRAAALADRTVVLKDGGVG